MSCSERMAEISLSRESMDLSGRGISFGAFGFHSEGLLLQLIPGWQLVDFLGDEVVFNHLAT